MTNTNQNKAGWHLRQSYLSLPETFYSKQELQSVEDPQIVYVNEDLAKELGLEIEQLYKEGLPYFSGNKAFKGIQPLAQAYAGHQFGQFTMLGDGRAVLLGEHVIEGEKTVDVQLKGSGRTVFSRGGDGRAALGPMIRELIMSEAMYGLGIPTTRSLAVVTTGEPVYRENVLEGAILTRIASSHIRVGTFQYAAAKGIKKELQALADYTIARHDPQLEHHEQKYVAWLKEVVRKQVQLIAKWQLVGFIHGVMNTDNMAINGETIDYGPCAMMDSYNPATVFSSIDRQGRYSYSNQPYMAAWNLARLAEAMLPLLAENEEEALNQAQSIISTFGSLYEAEYLQGMGKKLGLFTLEEGDKELIQGLLTLMETFEADYTNTFRSLTFKTLEEGKLFQADQFKSWYEIWQKRLMRQEQNEEMIKQLMLENNPAIIARNHIVEGVIEAAVDRGQMQPLLELLQVLKKPYSSTSIPAKYAKAPGKDFDGYQTFCGT
ncbi:protein adenylyltransferase SelO [Alkalihalobacillus pseudalcaliphilus]|uniref:protein adenylyltransferase SelO n=1 Tax=Alkalihalobacillus pseudalcaliphilus TaxID=79884 RepID=UPI00064E14DB|nr:hypothetical protein AB990_16965 [Alkalihalobacillus pseudalcaliphilus]